MEWLEERTLLSAILWNTNVSPNGGSFDDPRNWFGGRVPGPNDDAQINSGGGTVSIGASEAVKTLTTNPSISIAVNAGGSLDIAQASTINGSLMINSGTLSGIGSVTVNGALIWLSGTMTGAGTTIANGTLTLGSNAGTSTTIDILSGNRTLINKASATLATGPLGGAGSGLQIGAGSSLINDVGATFYFMNSASIIPASNFGTGTFVNKGTFGTSGSSLTSTMRVSLMNSGTISVQSGTLRLQAGGSFSGTSSTITSALGTMIDFNVGTYAIPVGAVVQAASANGVVQLSGATVSVDGQATFSNYIQRSGRLQGVGTLTLTGDSKWIGGTMTDTGTTENRGRLTLLNPSESDLFISGSPVLSGGRLLKNYANAVITQGNVVLSNYGLLVSPESTITNEIGATFTFSDSASILGTSSAAPLGLFLNSGTLVNGGFNGRIGILTTNLGTINVNGGSLTLSGGLTNLDPSTSTLTGGTYFLQGVLNLNGGPIVKNNANITLTTVGADIKNGSASLLGGFTANLPGASFALQAGNVINVGTFANAGTLSIANGSRFAAAGIFTQSGGSTTLAGGSFNGQTIGINGGTFDGSGTIVGNVASAGRFRPGGPGAPGMLTILGNYSQGAGGNLDIDLGGTSPGSGYDQLNVNGQVSLAGALNIGAIYHFSPSALSSFRVLAIAPGTATGKFNTIGGLDLGDSGLVPFFDPQSGEYLLANRKPTTTPPAPLIDPLGRAGFDLTATDAETASSALVFTITTVPTGALFGPNGVRINAGARFTGSPVHLTYQAPTGFPINFTDAFTYTVSDGGSPLDPNQTPLTTPPMTVNLSTGFNGTVNINGTSGDDTIVATSNAGNLQYTINGTTTSTNIPISAITQLNISGGNGNDTLQTIGLAINTKLDGGPGNDRLIVSGTPGNDTFTIGPGSTLFNGAAIVATEPLILNGGDGNDTFLFLDKASLNGSIDGGTGINTIDASAFKGSTTLDLQTLSFSPLVGTFANIQNVKGGSGADLLRGPSSGSTYNINANGAGSVGGLTFSGFENLEGGVGSDTFAFGPSGTIAGTINGGGGANTIDLSAWSAPLTANLATMSIGAVAGTFANINTIVGGSGLNTLIGPTAGSNIGVTSRNSGYVAGLLFYTNFAKVIGGPGNDVFQFAPGGGLTGTLDGGGGVNTLDYSGLPFSVGVDLSRMMAACLVNPFANAQRFVGGASTQNIIFGPSLGTAFTVTDPNAVFVNGSSFANFGRIFGGAGDDTFVMNNGASLTGMINGGGGSNWLDYRAFTTPMMFNLVAGGASGINAGIANIENARGGSGNDILIGDSLNNVLIGGPGNDTIDAGGGRNIVIGGLGSDTVYGSPGDDILIGGATSFDGDFASLDAILAEWTSADSYTTRVNLIKYGGGRNGALRLALGVTVIDDHNPDTLLGRGGQDWYFKGTEDTADNQLGENVN